MTGREVDVVDKDGIFGLFGIDVSPVARINLSQTILVSRVGVEPTRTFSSHSLLSRRRILST